MTIGIGIIILFLLVLSATFSFSETAMASVNKIKLQQLTDSKSKRKAKKAKRALDLVNNYNESITSIVIMNNIVNILATTLATIFFAKLVPGNAGAAAAISFSTMTVVTIVFGEVTPKILAKRHSL